MSLKIKSTAFEEGDVIPPKYTCDGMNISPPLFFEGIPKEAKSLVLISDDPDAPMGTWVHWVVYNLPTTTTKLPENFPHQEKMTDGAFQGKNDFGSVGYGGPCPPSGAHRYLFKLYALGTELALGPGATKAEIETVMQEHILEQAQLTGTYQRQ